MIPGEIMVGSGDIEINVGRATVTMQVANTGDRPVQVGSHYHFAETNAALAFDRAVARGYRLNIAAGTAVRFEPGQSRTVTLVALGGDRLVYGFRGEVMGPLDKRASGAAKAVKPTNKAKAGTPKAKTAARKTAAKATAKRRSTR